MITEDYVSFEVAKLLKEKGFVGECSRFYMPNGYGRWKYEHYHDFDINKRIECPTLQMACKWLREVHNLIISINFSYVSNSYTFLIKYITRHEMVWSDITESYEEAVEAALKYTLENLI